MPYQPASRLGCVVVEVYVLNQRNNFAVCVVAARRAHMVRALQLAAAWAFVWVCRNQRIVGTTVATTGTGDFTFRDSHVTTSRYWGMPPAERFKAFIPLGSWALFHLNTRAAKIQSFSGSATLIMRPCGLVAYFIPESRKSGKRFGVLFGHWFDAWFSKYLCFKGRTLGTWIGWQGQGDGLQSDLF